ncbi:MAG: hypothetical protein A2Y38_06165 [Spirochaetes bacterium GWB1_59_5]|nr:MAG: hypothetical protein A2Y38_06165 [Spirochaetes bacterium GWB1_59_5]
MFLPVYLAALAAIFFYALLPVVGAFMTRQQWRLFRKSVIEAASLPVFGTKLAPDAPLASGKFAADAGRCRVHGDVDALGGQHELWISCRNAVVVVDLRDSWVYILTGRAGDDTLERRRWSELPSIGPGARAFIAGAAELSGGRFVIGPAGKEPPLVILHDGDDDSVVRRSIWAGRHENEYWNPMTQVSMALGVVTMSGIVPLALRSRMPSLIGALTLTAAFSPILVLLPPGVVGFFVYRRFWRRARYCRARRDAEKLEGAKGKGDFSWQRRAYAATTASVLALASALAVNGWLLVVLLRRLL